MIMMETQLLSGSFFSLMVLIPELLSIGLY